MPDRKRLLLSYSLPVRGKVLFYPVRYDIILLAEVVLIRQYRNEWKYVCREGDLAQISEKISGVLERDANCGAQGKYEVHSMYFDQLNDLCVMDNNAGLSERYKYRIRYYGDDYTALKLERKEKNNGRCYKQSCHITLDIFQKLMDRKAEEVFWEAEEELLKKFCIDIMTKLFEPKVIIDYERTAFVEPITNIRITLDKNVSAAYELDDFLQGGYVRYPVQGKDEHVLEVKFDHILPGYIKNIMTGGSLIQTSFSKYYLGRLKLRNMGR